MFGILKKIVSAKTDDNKEMGFLDHLEELRWHVIRAGISVIFFASISLVYQDEIFKYIIFAPKQGDF
ncbi:MAG: hypothetical protein H7X99_04265, partial [Saprospiraceae bacterium]|nr:hypothetical protein [Saprospiraceae bacterium]